LKGSRIRSTIKISTFYKKTMANAPAPQNMGAVLSSVDHGAGMSGNESLAGSIGGGTMAGGTPTGQEFANADGTLSLANSLDIEGPLDFNKPIGPGVDAILGQAFQGHGGPLGFNPATGNIGGLAGDGVSHLQGTDLANLGLAGKLSAPSSITGSLTTSGGQGAGH
jgi:hypothetical protein